MPVQKSVRMPAVDFVTQGTYQRDTLVSTAVTWTAETEYEIALLASSVLATAGQGDKLFSWVRGKFYVFATDVTEMYEVGIFRCKITDATQDMNDNAVVELAMKEGRLFYHDFFMVPLGTYASAKPISFELYNVKLADNEELRLLVRPLVTCAANNGRVAGVLEWRQVGV